MTIRSILIGSQSGPNFTTQPKKLKHFGFSLEHFVYLLLLKSMSIQLYNVCLLVLVDR